MVPPPDSTGDEFPDFDSMTPEEQMAWLESLAKRQGVQDDELTTAADVDVPVPEDAVIDEPGYVPFSEREAAAKRPARSEPEPEPEPEPPPAVEELEPTVFEEPEPEELVGEPVSELDDEALALEEELDALAEAGDEGDPMQWLGSLAIESDEEMVGEVAAEEAEGAEPDILPEPEPEIAPAHAEIFAPEPDSSAESETVAEETVADTVEAAAAGADDDPLGGVDPMLWLESLAKRQGVQDDQLTTTADAAIEDVPEDAVIDEPGYVPYDIVAGGPRPATSRTDEEPEPAPEPEPEPEMMAEPEHEPVPEEADLLAELSPEPDVSLADWPEEPAPEVAAAMPEEVEDGEADAGLGWLEDLAAEPEGEDVDDVLAFDDDLFGDLGTALSPAEPEAPPVEATVAGADPLAGMTDEEIAQAQVEGRLTGEQELAWLKRQAAKLAAARESEPVEPAAVAGDELPPAEPGELPPWLQEIREETEGEAEDEGMPSALLEETEAEIDETVEMGEWLDEAPEEEALDLSELELDADEDVESLWSETPEETGQPAEAADHDSELVAFLEGDYVPDEPDQLAEALDAEYERRLAGDDSEPEWYTEAVERAAEDEDAEPGQAIVEPPVPEESTEEVLAEAAPVDMPDWLKETGGEVSAEDQADMPAWLLESDDELADVTSAEEIPDWLTEDVSEDEAPSAEEVPDWLAEEVEEEVEPSEVISAEAEPHLAEAAPAPEPAAEDPAPPPPTPAVTAPEVAAPVGEALIPDGELFDQYRARLDENPNDFASRLALARALRANVQLDASLDHYEMLIEAAQLLQDIGDDLGGMSQEHPDLPRVQRLLGDTFMRRGMLPQALEAYRRALEHL